ncbi:FAD-dependent monooxygenase [Deinococcus oregonensis]|uniref:FAD-dependent monooxygenase n=1 Tax=Deinococcus oregonensis TaxID=1805970 RepID=A0ABV6ASN0_9DEIO
MNNTPNGRVEVLIVGAGPTGLLAATMLAHYGVPFRIIDQDPGPTRESRATIVHGRTLELLDKLGLSDSVLHNGQRVFRATLVRNQRILANFPISGAEDDPSPFSFAVMHEQWKTEELFNQTLEAIGGHVEWSTKFLSLASETTGNRVTINDADGNQETLFARYIIAADGGRSPIRRQLGIAFEGSTYEQIAFTGDVEMRTDLSRDSVNLLYFREGFVGFVPLKSESGHAYRLIGTLPDKLEADVRAGRKNEIDADDLNSIFKTQLNTSATLLKVHQLQLYRLHRRLVSTYQHHNVFLAGDAAHLHSPAGGQGMNTGIGDAFNLSWKLSMVINGWAHPNLLDSYEPERKYVAQTVLNGSDKGFALEASKHPVMQIFNNYILPPLLRVAHKIPYARRFNSRLFSQNWINYAKSPSVAAANGSRGLQPGARFPYIKLEAGEHQGRTTHELIRGLNHQLFVFSGSPESTAQIQSVLHTYALPIDVITIVPGCSSAYETCGVNEPTMFLIRPDGHVAFRGSANNLNALEIIRKLVTVAGQERLAS